MKPKLIAHRGRHDQFHENTKEAFLAAGEADFYGIETDIHQTKDGIWITHHNDDIVSDGKLYPIRSLSWDEIRKMPLDNSLNHAAARVCLFTDYLEICKKYRKRPIIEIKNSPSGKAIRDLCELVDTRFGCQNVTFIAFYPQPLFRLRKLLGKKVHLQHLICNRHTRLICLIAAFLNIDIDIDHNLLSEKLVSKTHSRGKAVNVWTVNDPKMLEKMLSMGVDYVTTDNPGFLKLL